MNSFKYTGFSFKGVHSDSIPIIMATSKRYILPEMRRVTLTPDAEDGDVDLSDNNALGRALYENRKFSVDMLVTAADIYELQKALSTAANWLVGSGDLEFDDLPGIIWDATVADTVEYAPERYGKKAIITVDFIVKPFARDAESTDNVTLGSDFVLGSAVQIGLHAYSQTLAAGGGSFSVTNALNLPVQPVIHWTRTSNTGETVTVTITKSIVETPTKPTNPFEVPFWSESKVVSSLTITTDCIDFYISTKDKLIVGRADESSDYKVLIPDSGAFFELEPGTTYIGVSYGDTAPKAVLTVDWTPRYLYGRDWR